MKIILLYFISLFSFAQVDIVFKDSLLVKADYYYGTNSDLYFSKNNTFFSLNPDIKKTYFDSQLGKLENAIITNPLQIVLFYKDFNTIVLLDNQLNETTRIEGNLNSNNLIFEKIGLAEKNNLWFYEPNVQKIGLYNFKNDTFKFISTLLDKPIIFASSFYNTYYWVTNESSLFSISVYGKITFLGQIPSFDHLQVINQDVVLYLKDNLMYCYSISSQKSERIEVSEKTISNFHYKNEILSIFTNTKIVNLKIKLP